MTHILVGFSTRKNDWISRLICWVTRWRHSHVCLISPDRERIAESTSLPFPDPLTGEYRTGVRVVPAAYMLQRDMLEIRKIEHPDPAAVWKYAERMALEKVAYDGEYIGAWLLRRGGGDEHKVTCHELIEVAARLAGHALFPDGVKNTSPRDLYLISKEI